MKVYEVIVQDEYNNNYLIGFYSSLESAIPDINKQLETYNVSITKDDLQEYASTFNTCFDKCLGDVFEDNEDVCNVYIRGFIHDKECLLECISAL